MAGLSYNEMSAARWQTPVTLPVDGTLVTRSLGDWILLNNGLFTESYWCARGSLVCLQAAHKACGGRAPACEPGMSGHFWSC